MDQNRKRPRWRSSNFLWAVIIILAVWVLILVSVIVDDFLSGGRDKIGLWEWVGVLIIPVVLAAGAALLTNAQTQREVAAAHLRAQDEALQQYLDQVSNLLAERENPRKPTNSHPVSKLMQALDQVSNLFGEREDGGKPADSQLFSKLVQARTLALLLKLDADRKREPLKLIAQLELINRDNPLLSLKNAGFEGADLHEVTLFKVCLREADLRTADLTGADLGQSDLRQADLRGTNLTRAVLTNAYLAEANLLPYDRLNPAQLNRPHLLNGADASNVDKKNRLDLRKLNDLHLTVATLAEANLQGADLSGALLYRANLADADLTGTTLTDADLRRADLRRADLSGAEGVTEEQLEQAESLQGVTMPNGEKYEVWHKVKKVITCTPIKDLAIPVEIQNLKVNRGVAENEENRGSS
jgi:uncharacterized protein YjbI with pentapeptide repeats